MAKIKKNKGNYIDRVKRDFSRNKYIYMLMLPVITFFILFEYKPMYGAVIAFQNYRPFKGISGSEWVGLYHFKQFLRDPYYLRIVRNSFMINILQLIFVFPCPIIFAILLNEVKVKAFKRTVQTISYMPHFIAIVVICGLINQWCQTDGLINDIIEFFGRGKKKSVIGSRCILSNLYYF